MRRRGPDPVSSLLAAALCVLFVMPAPAFGQAAPDTAAGENEPAPGTAPDENLTPRSRYNIGLVAYAGGDPTGATQSFLQARDEAGPDPELRYRAAFNLGMALAGTADTVQEEDPENAIETLRQSAAWFQDAVRLGSDRDDDARVNLEIVLRRIQRLADQLNKSNKLEARLDRVIDDQRGLRDRIRRLLQSVEAEGVAAEPVGFQREFDGVATFERTLLAEAGSISDLAGDELALIDNKTEEEISQEEQVRRVQLQNLEYYLQAARQSLSDTRRRLRKLEGEPAHRRADAALAELKQAREQLRDPVTVLKGITQDETELMVHTQGLDALSGGAIRLDADAPAAPPSWLTPDHLSERQQNMALRTREVVARLEAGVNSAENSPDEADDAGAAAGDRPDRDPAQQRVLEAAQEAIPFLQDAEEAMANALSALPLEQLATATEEQGNAIRALLKSIERFAGVRDLIELAYADQARVVALLTPPDSQTAQPPELANLPTEERSRLVGEAVAANRERLDRLDGLLEDERHAAEEQATGQAATGGDPNAPADAAEQALESIRQQYDTAQDLRRRAVQSLASLDGRLTEAAAGETVMLLGPAQETLTRLEDLRRLFFSIIEHLQELLRQQSETHDSTATAQFEAAEQPAELGLVNDRQGRHAGSGKALAQALAQQADAASASNDPQKQQSAEPLTEATNEVRAAAGRMQDAGGLLAAAVEHAGMESVDLEPALDNQIAAMEHLENAIRLLQPPGQQKQDEQQQQQQAQQQPQPEEEMSQRQALRRLQAIRDREAERQRERRERAKPEPVEKDW